MATKHAGIIASDEADKLYSYPTLPNNADKRLSGKGTWVDKYTHPTPFPVTTPIDEELAEQGYYSECAEDLPTLPGIVEYPDHNVTVNCQILDPPDVTLKAGEPIVIPLTIYDSLGHAAEHHLQWFYLPAAYSHPTYTARTGKPTANATIGTAGGNVVISQITSDAKGHVTGANDKTITFSPHPTIAAATGQPTGNQTPAFGGTFNTNQVSRDALGHVSAITTRTVKIPDTAATTLAAGLMSKDDKIKLNGIATNANNYVHPTIAAATVGPTANASPAFGGTFTVPQVARDALGHVSAITARTITIPSAVATTSANGLMSKDDKASLNTAAADCAAIKTKVTTEMTRVEATNEIQFKWSDGTIAFRIPKAGNY